MRFVCRNQCLRFFSAIAAAVLCTDAVGRADVLLIADDCSVSSVEFVELTDTSLVHMDGESGWRTVPLSEYIGFISTGAAIRQPTPRGQLRLVDGQVIPGSILSNPDSDTDTVAWNHPWLSRIEVPLDQVAAILVAADAVMPEIGRSDVVVLGNGDRYEGFIVDIGDPLSLDVDQADGSISRLTIPLDRVSAIGLVAQSRPPANRRVWFTDGTILDVRHFRVGDDGLVRLQSVWASGSDEVEMPFIRIAGALFAPGRLTPLASLRVAEVTGPAHRYVIPHPRASVEPTPLDLADISMHGTQVARWQLPNDITRFAASAELPEHARIWGDFDLVVRVDGMERARVHMNSSMPSAEINIAVDGGSQLEIEITEGARGSVQDEVVLRRAMLLSR